MSDMSEATADQVSAEVVEQEQLEQQPQQGDPADAEEPVGNLDGDDTAEAGDDWPTQKKLNKPRDIRPASGAKKAHLTPQPEPLVPASFFVQK